MSLRFQTWQRVLALLVVGLIAMGVPAVSRAQDNDADKPKARPASQPLVIFNVASVDRLIGDVRYLFEASGQPQINEMIDKGLVGANNLKGLQRTKPMGAMLFLAPGLPPTPFLVSYVPVANIEELIQTIGGGGNTVLRRVEGETDRFELVGQDGNPQQIVLRGGYAFISQDAENLDQKFLDPAKLTKGLSARHDLAITLRLNTVPEVIKTTLLGTLRAQFNANMQQRDDEEDGPYKLRRNNEGNTLEFLELLIAEGDRITIGINASKENKNAILEILFEAKASGKWAKALKKIDSRPSYFAPLIDEKAPLSFSLSWKMDKREQDNTTDFLRILEPQIAAQLEPVAPAVHNLFAALNKTAVTGHADAFFQYKVVPPERMALFGGLKVEEGKQLSAAVRSILSELQRNPEVAEMELDIDSHKGVSFHRLGSRAQAVSPANQRIYGGTPSVYVGTGANVVWFSLGDSGSLDAAKEAIDKLATARATVGKRQRGAPFQFVFNMTPWIDKLDADRPFTRLVRQAFQGGKDRLQVDVRPSDNGMRMQLKVEEGFLKLLGTAIGRGVEEGRQRREERRDAAEEESGRERRAP
ncbi:MAG TPA: hypothetical protein DCE47_05510 [Planctomycetaceae bacterium]|nr:hypothetical protein [Planctomycetaceae bacterium]HCD00534.1 hypothetical protein [Planctomycetaceae bacterium]|tara:strand:+ start:471 stop:2228 length:1758 start_codon:yes stop_codon:yes gene_type:complete